jgi:tetratricopeptide (TPR) repeat protein
LQAALCSCSWHGYANREKRAMLNPRSNTSAARARWSLGTAILLSGLAVSLIGAGRPATPEDSIRQANDAFELGDLDAAEQLYAQAEERAADPGLIAFNKGTALYHLSDFRRGELCFRRALGDAAIPSERRERALYNLGNCLVRQAGETDMRQLQSAIDCYEMVLRETQDEGLRSDAGHNLELAKLLWAKARARRPQGERDPDWDEPKEPKQPPPDPTKPPEGTGADGTDDGQKKLDSGPKVDIGKGPGTGLVPKEAEKAAPGQGNLPVLPDTEEVRSLPLEDIRAELQRAGQRLQRERQKLREEATMGERPRANDW